MKKNTINPRIDNTTMSEKWIYAKQESVIALLNDAKAEHIESLYLTNHSMIDWSIIASGHSSTHVRAMTSRLVRHAKSMKWPYQGIEGLQQSQWVVIDLGDGIVHVMQPEARAFYQLEKLHFLPDTILNTLSSVGQSIAI